MTDASPAEVQVDAVALYFKRRAEAAEADGLAMAIALRDAERKNVEFGRIIESLRAEAGHIEAKSKPKN